mgnify:CR=1 FL=1
MQHIKHIIFCLIIFSNTCFGKEFDELFVVYDPIDNPSKIEKSINNSFNTMIYRLSGTNSPSNIWKIINAGNSRKDFIKSYSIKNIDSKSYLEVNFDKNLLISKFDDLSISVIGKSRPVILFLINIDSGLSDPYFLTFSESKSLIDSSIQNYLKKFANIIGILRKTNFGTLFNVRSIRKASDLAYTSHALSAHTDNPYRRPIPGIQLLHCLKNISFYLPNYLFLTNLARKKPSHL